MSTMLSALRSGANVMSVDPGDVRVGVSLWRWNGRDAPIEMFRDTMLREAYLDVLRESIRWSTVGYVILESYRLRKARNRGGSQLHTSRTIGATELFAGVQGAALILSDPQNYQLAAKHTGTTWKGQHCPDDVSAYLHAYYFFEQKGVLRPTHDVV